MGEMPYTSRIYPVLFANAKILDVLQINLAPVLKRVLPYQIVSIEGENILIEQEFETK